MTPTKPMNFAKVAAIAVEYQVALQESHAYGRRIGPMVAAWDRARLEGADKQCLAHLNQQFMQLDMRSAHWRRIVQRHTHALAYAARLFNIDPSPILALYECRMRLLPDEMQQHQDGMLLGAVEVFRTTDCTVELACKVAEQIAAEARIRAAGQTLFDDSLPDDSENSSTALPSKGIIGTVDGTGIWIGEQASVAIQDHPAATPSANDAAQKAGCGLSIPAASDSTGQSTQDREATKSLPSAALPDNGSMPTPPEGGPLRGNRFRWGQNPPVFVRPLAWEILNYLWPRPDKSAPATTVINAVWGSRGREIPGPEGDAVKSAIRECNRALETAKCPLRVSHRGSYISLILPRKK